MASTSTQCGSLLPQWVSLRSIPTMWLPPLWHRDRSRGRTVLRVRRRSMDRPSALWHRASHRVHICCRWLPRASATGCEAGHRCRPYSETPHCSLPPRSGWQGALLVGLVGGVTFLKKKRKENPNLPVLPPLKPSSPGFSAERVQLRLSPSRCPGHHSTQFFLSQTGKNHLGMEKTSQPCHSFWLHNLSITDLRLNCWPKGSLSLVSEDTWSSPWGKKPSSHFPYPITRPFNITTDQLLRENSDISPNTSSWYVCLILPYLFSTTQV